MKIQEQAPAKINLALNILGRRTDGYHELRMVMQSVSLCDTVTVEETGIGFTLLSDGFTVPAGKSSLEQQAAEAFFAAVGRPVPPLTVHLEKTTPAYAGLGGGSADVAERQIMAGGQKLDVLFLDGLADGIWIDAPGFAEDQVREIELMILQAARVRFSHTEYIACPSCGRTLYDIEKTLAAVKSRTSHLKNLKIGVMGCIVNGPGEMADADYGYVGAGPGRITLYKGREVVERDIPQEEALDRLVELIKADGEWVEP